MKSKLRCFFQEFEGRHSPSNGKIDFLLHLENCLQCIEASVMVDPWKDIEGVSSQPAEWYSSLETDQQYIGEQSRRLREKSIALRNSVGVPICTPSIC